MGWNIWSLSWNYEEQCRNNSFISFCVLDQCWTPRALTKYYFTILYLWRSESRASHACQMARCHLYLSHPPLRGETHSWFFSFKGPPSPLIPLGTFHTITHRSRLWWATPSLQVSMWLLGTCLRRARSWPWFEDPDLNHNHKSFFKCVGEENHQLTDIRPWGVLRQTLILLIINCK